MQYLGYSDQKNRKLEQVGKRDPDTDAQFNFINNAKKYLNKDSVAIISVDSKNKVNIGNYYAEGTTLKEKGNPTKVKDHDFITSNLNDLLKKVLSEKFDKNSTENDIKNLGDKEYELLRKISLTEYTGKENLYGVYDVRGNSLSASLGISHDTAEFAVNTIEKWYVNYGKDIKLIYVLCDGGGSNGSRIRLWKYLLQKFSNKYNIAVMVSHFAPGTSKYNPIEHRAFNNVSRNWRGCPLYNINTVLSFISSTTTETGLKCSASLDVNLCQTKIKVSDEEMSKVNIYRSSFRGDWNYIICPFGKTTEEFYEFFKELGYEFKLTPFTKNNKKGKKTKINQNNDNESYENFDNLDQQSQGDPSDSAAA